MQYRFIHPGQLKTIARWALVLFVMAWVNLAIQSPVHAAMKHNNELPCHCDVTLCDTVLNMEEQADDGLAALTPVIGDIQIAFVQPASIGVNQLLVEQHLQRAALQYGEYSPPPLLLNTILII